MSTPGTPVLDAIECENLRTTLILGENRYTDREKAEFRFRMEQEHPYPEGAEMALFGGDDERLTDWVPVAQGSWRMPDDAPNRLAVRVWIRIGDTLHHSRGVFMTPQPGCKATVMFGPTTWVEYIKRKGLPAEWATEQR